MNVGVRQCRFGNDVDFVPYKLSSKQEAKKLPGQFQLKGLWMRKLRSQGDWIHVTFTCVRAGLLLSQERNAIMVFS